MTIEIRDERPEDTEAVRELNRLAFGQDLEASIVDALRSNGAILLSLVAALDDRIAGHIVFSPILVGDVQGAALGPMAVAPDVQRQGIGSRLVEAGTERIRAQGWPFIIVLGHSAFYPRFGFVPARTCGITCEWDVPDNVFMVRVLDPVRMQRVSGLARYRSEFSLAV